MKKLLIMLIVMLTVVIPARRVSGDQKRIVCEGSTTVLPICQAVAEEFMNRNKGVDISVRGGGSGVGIVSLIDGTCDIANASRPMKDSELQKAAGRGKSPKAHVIAMDGIAVIVHKSNPVNVLTKKQIKDIFTGKISNWAEVGGPDMKIVVISRDSASGTFEAFGELALDKEKVRSDALMEMSNGKVVAVVEKTPGAIGYVGIGFVSDKVKAIEVDGIKCTKENVLSGKYPLSRPLFMYTNGNPSGVVKDFIDFLLSPDGQKIVETSGYVPLK